jgi:hypothetical protein
LIGIAAAEMTVKGALRCPGRESQHQCRCRRERWESQHRCRLGRERWESQRMCRLGRERQHRCRPGQMNQHRVPGRMNQHRLPPPLAVEHAGRMPWHWPRHHELCLPCPGLYLQAMASSRPGCSRSAWPTKSGPDMKRSDMATHHPCTYRLWSIHIHPTYAYIYTYIHTYVKHSV